MSFPIPDKVLVTGASGYIAAHVVNQLWLLGYEIIGTVRSSSKGEFLADKFPGFRYEIVEDIVKENAFDEVFKSHPDIKYALHLASPVFVDTTDYVKSFVNPAVSGTLSALNAAHKYGKNFKKFVYTSSVVAAFPFEKGMKHPELTYTEESWNPIRIEEAGANWLNGYSASKKFAEKSMWDFQEKEKPSFSITSIIVPMVLGPPIHDATYENIGSTPGYFKNLINTPVGGDITQSIFIGQIDVRDLARAHIFAMTRPSTDSKRLFPFAGLADEQLILDVLHKARPEATSETTIGNLETFDASKYSNFDNSATRSLLDFEFISTAKSFTDTFDALEILKKKSTK